MLQRFKCMSFSRSLKLAACVGRWRHIMAYSTHSLAELRPLVGVVQLTCTSDKEANFAQASALIKKASQRRAQMVFLPECFDFVAESKEEMMSCAETLAGETISKYRSLAAELNMWLSLGGFHEKTESQTDRRIFNTHVLIDDSGSIQASYRKTHLFNVDIPGGVRLTETDVALPGPAVIPPVNTPAGKLGMAICYDMRFPELSIALTQQGSDILSYPSAFTQPTGTAHWQVLLRSRAIENQCYVIAAAQTGKHNAKRSSYGHSMVVDPWGCVVAECQDTPGLITAEIDLDYLSRRRAEMPVWSHRRHDLYGHIQCVTQGSIEEQTSYQFGQHVIPSSCLFYKSPLSMAFVNRKPVIPGHVLVAPIEPRERLADLNPAQVSDLFLTAQKVGKVVQEKYGGNSLTVSVQDGPDAGQTVKHVHVHILPRKPGDFKNNDDIYEKLEHHDDNVAESQWRSDDDMAQEAAALRTLLS